MCLKFMIFINGGKNLISSLQLRFMKTCHTCDMYQAICKMYHSFNPIQGITAGYQNSWKMKTVQYFEFFAKCHHFPLIRIHKTMESIRIHNNGKYYLCLM